MKTRSLIEMSTNTVRYTAAVAVALWLAILPSTASAQDGLPITSSSFMISTDRGLYSAEFIAGSHSEIVTAIFVYRIGGPKRVTLSYELQDRSSVLSVDGVEWRYRGTPLLLWDEDSNRATEVVGDVGSLSGGKHDPRSVEVAVIQWARKRFEASAVPHQGE